MKQIKAILVKPAKEPEVVYIDDAVSGLQKAVGGYFEFVSTNFDNVAIICNEEGKLQRLPENRILRNIYGNYDVIVGNFLIVGINGEDLCDLDDHQIPYLIEVFSNVICEV